MYDKLISFFLLLCFGHTLVAQEVVDSLIIVDSLQLEEVVQSDCLFEHFVKDSIHEISVITNFDTLEHYRIKESYQDALLTYPLADGLIDTLKVKVHTRGKMRKRVCTYPSLKLKFKKAMLAEMGLSDENKYKLVCQCKDGKDGEQLLLKEYLAYKLYNLVTEDSYKVHLLKINYHDTAGGGSKKRYAFLLENEHGMAARRGGESLERKDFAKEKLSRKRVVQLSLFQYMIGNTDWNISYLHNVKLLSGPEGKMIIPVAYDFDYSGLVNAPYAIPNPDLADLRYVTDRWFMASGCSEGEIIVHLNQFRNKKKIILDTCENFELLNKRSRKHVCKFMTDFFKAIDNPKKVKRVFVR